MSAVASIRRIKAIAAREVRSAFVGPTAWIVLALSGLVAAGSFFGATFDDGQPATLRTVMLAAGWALLATAPALSKRPSVKPSSLRSGSSAAAKGACSTGSTPTRMREPATSASHAKNAPRNATAWLEVVLDTAMPMHAAAKPARKSPSSPQAISP